MRRNAEFTLLIACILALAACSTGSMSGKTAKEPVETAQSAEQKPVAPGSTGVAKSQDATEAEKLARKVMEQAGADQLDEVAEVGFSFVVYESGKPVFRAQHRYDRVNQRDRITWIDPASPLGNRFDVLIDLETKQVEGTIDGEPITDAERDQIAPYASRRWVNDYYWYALPLKLRDPGVNLELVEPRTWKDKKYRVLKMTFDDVGLTPGDAYWLYIDPDTHRIDRWDMKLEQTKGKPIAVSRTAYRQVGPLELSHQHRWLNGARTLAIDDTYINESLRERPYHFEATDFEYEEAQKSAKSAKPGFSPPNP